MMARIKFHPNLSEEKWQSYDRARQVLMIANELNRAQNWLNKDGLENTLPCYERALELTDLTIDDEKWQRRRKELLRFRECLAELYISDKKSLKVNNQLYHGLISLSVEAYNLLYQH